MKIMLKSYLNGWWMTGIYGRRKGVYWFLGFSRAATPLEQLLIKIDLKDNHADPDSLIWKKGGKWYTENNDA
jgi:hypothetical protein